MQEEKKEVALVIDKTGDITIQDNIIKFKDHVEKGLVKCDASKLVTDTDFDNGKLLVKGLDSYRAQIKSGIDALDMENIRKVKAILLDLDKKIMNKSSEFTKAIKTRREERKTNIIEDSFKGIEELKTMFPTSKQEFTSKCEDLCKGKSSFSNMQEAINNLKIVITATTDRKEKRFSELKETVTSFFKENDILKTEYDIEKGCLVFVREDYNDDQVQLYLDNSKLQYDKLKEEARVKEQEKLDSEKKQEEIAEKVEEKQEVKNEEVIAEKKQEIPLVVLNLKITCSISQSSELLQFLERNKIKVERIK